MTMFARLEPEGEPGAALRIVHRASMVLAVVGGLLLLGVALLVTASVLLRWLTRQGIAGDFELAQMGMAVAVFAFMPLCQLLGRNIFIDTFTGWLPGWARNGLDALWALVYAAVAGLVCWQMALGGRETVASGTTTMVLGLPLGWPIVIAACLTAWLALVALVTAARALLAARP